MFQNRKKSGKHLICDIRDIKIDYSFGEVIDLMEYICEEYNFTILEQSHYKFDDDKAFTIFFLLGESHFSVHTYPECNTIALDLYTCKDYKDNAEYLDILEVLQSFFKTTIVYQIIDRTF